MPQTFDPETFDIHASQHPLRVLKETPAESTDAVKKDLEGLEKEASHGKHQRSVLIALSANLLFPGLGPLYIKSTVVGGALFFSNMFFLFFFATPVYFLFLFLNRPLAGVVVEPLIGTSYQALTVQALPFPPLGALYLTGILSLVTWVYLLYLIKQNRGDYHLTH